MIKCLNCGKELEDDSKFCDDCGTPVPEPSVQTAVEEQANTPSEECVFCPKCGKKLPAGALFCDSCGASLGAVSQDPTPTFAAPAGQPVSSQPASNQPVSSQPASSQPVSGQPVSSQPVSSQPASSQPAGGQSAGKKKKFPVIGIVAACLVIAVVACVGVLFTVFSKSSGSTVDCAIYIKEKEMFFSNLKSKVSSQVTESLSEDRDLSNSDFASANYTLSYLTTISADGKYLFFPDKVDGGDWTLYYSPLSKLGDKTTKIDSGIAEYEVNDSATYVTYMKSNDTLYSYNMKKGDKEKISGDVEGFAASDDGKKVYYIDDEGTLYLWTMGKGKEKIDSDIYKLYYISEDFKTVYYNKDDNLYRNSIGKDREKIASDVDKVIKVFDSGCVYYYKELDDMSVDMFIADDMAEKDKNMEKPEYPNYYSYSDRTLYNNAVEEYNKAQEEYSAKLRRDRLREECERMVSNWSIGTFYYYDGKKETEIGIGTLDAYDVASASETLVFLSLDLENLDKVKLSKIEENDISVYEAVEESLEEAWVFSLALKDELITTDVEVDEHIELEINSDGSRILYLSDYNYEKQEGDLYLMTIKGKKISDAELIESDVSSYYFGFAGDSYVYYTDVKNYEGDLYMDGKAVAYDVYVSMRASNSGAYYFYTDYDTDKSRGTLQCYANGKTTKVADDVYDYYVLGNKKLLILSNYNTNKYKGELYLYNSGKLKSLDDDVVCILRPSMSRRASIYNY